MLQINFNYSYYILIFTLKIGSTGPYHLVCLRALKIVEPALLAILGLCESEVIGHHREYELLLWRSTLQHPEYCGLV